MADPPHPAPLRSRAWQPLMRVAALTVLLLGGMLALVVGTGGLPGQFGQTPTPGLRCFAQLAFLELQNSTALWGPTAGGRAELARVGCLFPLPGTPSPCRGSPAR